jgi:hypothetical protein
MKPQLDPIAPGIEKRTVRPSVTEFGNSCEWLPGSAHKRCNPFMAFDGRAAGDGGGCPFFDKMLRLAFAAAPVGMWATPLRCPHIHRFARATHAGG